MPAKTGIVPEKLGGGLVGYALNDRPHTIDVALSSALDLNRPAGSQRSG